MKNPKKKARLERMLKLYANRRTRRILSGMIGEEGSELHGKIPGYVPRDQQ